MQTLLLLAAEPLDRGLAAVLGVIAGGLLAWVIIRVVSGNLIGNARKEAEQITQTAKTEAEAHRQKAELEAERRAAKRREEVDAEIAEAQTQLKQDYARLAKREDTLDRKLEKISNTENRLEEREAGIRQQEQDLDQVRAELEENRAQIKQRLQDVSGMSVEQARELLMEEVRIETEHEANALARTIIEETEGQARARSREITLQAIQRYAAEHVADSTVRSVRIPSDDMKGRIIGREGRNIRALERATGVDILVDDTPGVIAVSCFDPIRRTIASEALQRLVADGRVHPARIEEVVESIRKDMTERIIKAGNDAVMEGNIRGLSPKIIEAMGKLSFRTSYGQNVLRHSMEVAYIAQIIADQLGLKGDLARRCGFLHDIGKAMDHEMEGGHPAIGMEFCRRHGEKSEEVLNAIGGHHGDIESTTPYTPIVMAADAISGARPGARRESMEMYIKRLEQLEGIAKENRLVTEAHAFQAGREVRVILDARHSTDNDAFSLARSIAHKVEEEMTFPGEIKVTVLREVRSEALAR
jgi:ribonuclease Y